MGANKHESLEMKVQVKEQRMLGAVTVMNTFSYKIGKMTVHSLGIE